MIVNGVEALPDTNVVRVRCFQVSHLAAGCIIVFQLCFSSTSPCPATTAPPGSSAQQSGDLIGDGGAVYKCGHDEAADRSLEVLGCLWTSAARLPPLHLDI